MTDWIAFKNTERFSTATKDKDYFIKMNKIDGLCQVDEGIAVQCMVLISGKWIPVDGDYEDLKRALAS